jgi:hypothetical protein
MNHSGGFQIDSFSASPFGHAYNVHGLKVRESLSTKPVPRILKLDDEKV